MIIYQKQLPSSLLTQWRVKSSLSLIYQHINHSNVSSSCYHYLTFSLSSRDLHSYLPVQPLRLFRASASSSRLRSEVDLLLGPGCQLSDNPLVQGLELLGLVVD
ncbi:hypothetical protein FGO68_gene17054 [Halteria grandinella]|uniref:Uncharacterized protein n=1 Tax=Halteria grandinella TaxID=5974 RepID=A0A8J8NEW1_HALGN|nr:hypothetical protein FGO68_gene17054 [Halteria grandinella]